MIRHFLQQAEIAFIFVSVAATYFMVLYNGPRALISLIVGAH